MVDITGVRFRSAGKVYYFDVKDYELRIGDHVIVETARGPAFGIVATRPRNVSDDMVAQPLRAVLRIASEEDEKKREELGKKEKEALRICREKVHNHGLEMKVVDAEYAFDGNQLLFYFTADGRVDFRELVKDLASVFHTRIELRQIGVRDETRMLGGIGICGRELCCAAYLNDFAPVSIKMAKEQNLSLNPGKISGVCGRLMCCLKNEEETYEFLNQKMPKTGWAATTAEGRTGKVIELNVLRQRVRVLFEDGDSKEAENFSVDELSFQPRKRKDETAQAGREKDSQRKKGKRPEGSGENGRKNTEKGRENAERDTEERKGTEGNRETKDTDGRREPAENREEIAGKSAGSTAVEKAAAQISELRLTMTEEVVAAGAAAAVISKRAEISEKPVLPNGVGGPEKSGKESSDPDRNVPGRYKGRRRAAGRDGRFYDRGRMEGDSDGMETAGTEERGGRRWNRPRRRPAGEDGMTRGEASEKSGAEYRNRFDRQNRRPAAGAEQSARGGKGAAGEQSRLRGKERGPEERPKRSAGGEREFGNGQRRSAGGERESAERQRRFRKEDRRPAGGHERPEKRRRDPSGEGTVKKTNEMSIYTGKTDS